MSDAPTFTTIQWREIVERVDPEPEDTTEYEFSNGRKFKRESDGKLHGEI
jgi:hypothetical protein